MPPLHNIVPWRPAAANGDLKWPFPHRPCFEQDDLSQSLLDVLTLWRGRSTKALAFRAQPFVRLDRPPSLHPMVTHMGLLDLSAELPVLSPGLGLTLCDSTCLMWGQDQLAEGKQ